MELEALVAQSGQSAEALRARYYISFAPGRCDTGSRCEMGVLVLQEHLREQWNIDSKERLPLLSYDAWRLEKTRIYYPENIYAFTFKTPFIHGQRTTLKRHLKLARKILDRVRLTNGEAPSPEDTSAVLTSFRNRNPYYANLDVGIALIEKCVDIDDELNLGHAAFHNEEYTLAQSHYLRAAGGIRDVSRRLSRGLILPRYMQSELELGEFGQPGSGTSKKSKIIPTLPPGSGWIGGAGDSDALLHMTSAGITKAQKDFVKQLYYAYLPGNVPGVDLGRGQIPLGGVDAQGLFLPMAASYAGPSGASSAWFAHLASKGWRVSGQVLQVQSGSLSLNWEIDSGGYVHFRLVGGQTHWSSLLYDGEPTLTDIGLEVEFSYAQGATQGLVFRAEGAEAALSAGFVGIKGDKAIFGHFDKSLTPTAFGPVRDVKITPWTRVRIHLRVIGNGVRAEFSVMKNNTWEPLASLPASQGIPPVTLPAGMAATGLFGLYSFSTGDVPSFGKFKAWDLSAAKGTFSDLAFFLESGYPAGVTFSPPVDNPRPKQLLLGGSTSAYVTRKASPADSTTLGNFLDTLPQHISIDYSEAAYIVAENVVDSGFDAFHSSVEGVPVAGLWYGQGDDRLNREQLGKLLDLLPNLFVQQYFFVLPLCLGDVANALGQYDEARNWYRMVYDERPDKEAERPVYRYLNTVIEAPMVALLIASNALDHANALFRLDTRESVQQARRSYKDVLRLLDSEDCCGLGLTAALDQTVNAVFDGTLAATDANAVWKALLSLSEAAPDEAKSLAATIEDTLKSAVDAPTALKAIKRQISDANRRSKGARPDPWPDIEKLDQRLADCERRHPEVLDALDGRAAAIPSPVPTSSVLPNVIVAETGSSVARAVIQIDDGGLLAAPGQVFPESPGLAYAVAAAFDADTQGDKLFWKTPPAANGSKLALAYPDYTIDFTREFCAPPNPWAQSMVQRACLGLRHIDLCFNALGLPQRDTTEYRFDYLIALARNYATLAAASERDFLQFKEKFESDTLELLNATQAAALVQGGVELSDLMIQDAYDHVAGAAQQVSGINLQIQQVESRLNDLQDPVWGIFGIVGASLATAIGSLMTSGAAAAALGVALSWFSKAGAVAAGVGSTVGGVVGYLRGLEDNETALRNQLDRLRTTDHSAAWLNLINAERRVRSARQQARIARLESAFAAERAALLADQFLNPQLWSFLAKGIKKNHRTYLHYAILCAWQAQRALEFDRGLEPTRRFATSWPQRPGQHAGLDIVRFDYVQPAQQGLLSADALLRDITTLEQEKLQKDRRKLEITKVTSLAEQFPLDFIEFIETGKLSFATELTDFDMDYPGHYQRRIRDVRVRVFGLIGSEGIKATLSHLGPSRVVVKQHDPETGAVGFVEKTLVHPMASATLSDPQPGGIGKASLSIAGPMLRAFEGKGVAGHWSFEMTQSGNRIDFHTITDIQLVIEYSALSDPQWRAQVISALPKTRSAIRAYSFCADFADACYHLKDSDGPIGMVTTDDVDTGQHTLVFHTREDDSPRGQRNRRLRHISLYARSASGVDYSSLAPYLACSQGLAAAGTAPTAMQFQSAGNPGPFTAAAVPPAATPSAPHFLGRWAARDMVSGQEDVSPVQTWYLHIPPAANAAFALLDAQNQPVLVDGQMVYDFAGIQDVLFLLEYDYDIEPPGA